MAFRSEKPIVRPTRLGPKGDAPFPSARGTIYIERAAPLDLVKIKAFKDPKGIQRAEIVKIIEPSPYRQAATCPHYDQCGNCTLLHLKTEYYRKWKTEVVKEAFLKIGVSPEQWLKPIFSQGHNRRRATFTLLKKRGKTTMGYYKRRSQELSEINSCEIAHPKILELKAFLKPYLHFLVTEGEPLDLLIQLVGDRIDLVLKGPVGKIGKPDKAFKQLVRDIFEVSMVARVSWKDKSSVVPLFESSPMELSFGDLKVKLPPGAFLQPTQEGEKTLVEAVINSIPHSGRYADLFAGCGTFSGPMLKYGSVEAFESDLLAVKSLAQASKNKELGVYRRDLFKNPLLHRDISKFDAVIFDPPRAGCIEQSHEMALSKCPTLIGVSCNPATFARDAKTIVRGGYRLKSLQVVDQFLGSHHVEVVGVFKKY